MNSETDKKAIDFTAATNPESIFTIAIGGNIVSRGVTFNNLLSMFFTRDVKHKMQQDTYIQRARMFGNRNPYLGYFELTIPKSLYLNWHKCFVFHRLALESIKSGSAPTWLEDRKTRAAASASVDKTTVSINAGEMGFEIFDYDKRIEDIIIDDKVAANKKLEIIHQELGDHCIPSYLTQFIKSLRIEKKQSLAIHPSSSIVNRADVDQEKIERPKKFIGDSEMQKSKYPDAIHHIKIFYNAKNRARVFYKYSADNIKFISNLK